MGLARKCLEDGKKNSDLGVAKTRSFREKVLDFYADIFGSVSNKLVIIC
jgi:hypothetical protein